MAKKSSKSNLKTVTAADPLPTITYQQTLGSMPLLEQIAVLASLADSLATSLAGIEAALLEAEDK